MVMRAGLRALALCAFSIAVAPTQVASAVAVGSTAPTPRRDVSANGEWGFGVLSGQSERSFFVVPMWDDTPGVDPPVAMAACGISGRVIPIQFWGALGAFRARPPFGQRRCAHARSSAPFSHCSPRAPELRHCVGTVVV
jgi:hypothetical protein